MNTTSENCETTVPLRTRPSRVVRLLLAMTSVAETSTRWQREEFPLLPMCPSSSPALKDARDSLVVDLRLIS